MEKKDQIHNFFYVISMFIVTKFGENFEDKIDNYF